MKKIIQNKNDLKWLEQNYSTLRLIKPYILEGRLSFQMLKSNDNYYINPSIEQIHNIKKSDVYICDSYNIRIFWGKNDQFPKAYEVGGKLEATAKRLGKSIIDMHQFPKSGALCLATPMELQRTFRI